MSHTGHIVAFEKKPAVNEAVMDHHDLLKTMSRRSSMRDADPASVTAARPRPAKQQRALMPVPVGLTSDARLLTGRGRISVSDLVAGDSVWTLDAGMNTLTRVIERKIKFSDQNGYMRPIKIAAGAFGRGAPGCDIRVAPGQRLLINDWRAKHYFGVPEILVQAIDLIGQTGVTRDATCVAETFTYLQFDGFQLIETNGVISESFMLERRFDRYKSGAPRNAQTLAPSRPVINSDRCAALQTADVYKPAEPVERPQAAQHMDMAAQ